MSENTSPQTPAHQIPGKVISALKQKPNPFRHHVVSSPYDLHSAPLVEEYLKTVQGKVEKAFEMYERGDLSYPLLLIYGDTGSGKTFFLNHLVKEKHRALYSEAEKTKGYFLIPVSPVEITKNSLSADKVASILWNSLIQKLKEDKIPGFLPGCPLDLYQHNIARQIMENKEEDEYKDIYPRNFVAKLFGWDISKEAKDIYRKIKKDPWLPKQSFFPENTEDSLQQKIIHSLILEVRDDRTLSSESDKKIAIWFLEQLRGEKTTAPLLEGLSDGEKLYHFTLFSQKVEIPLSFVFDQFEDLKLLPEEVNQNCQRFFVSMIHLIKELRELSGERETLLSIPLFICSLAGGPEHLLLKNSLDRLTPLADGKRYISMNEKENQISFETALEFTTVYLKPLLEPVCENLSADQKKIYPWTEKKLKEMFFTLEARGRVLPRDWISLCQKEWNLWQETSPDGITKREEMPGEDGIVKSEEKPEKGGPVSLENFGVGLETDISPVSTPSLSPFVFEEFWKKQKFIEGVLACKKEYFKNGNSTEIFSCFFDFLKRNPLTFANGKTLQCKEIWNTSTSFKERIIWICAFRFSRWKGYRALTISSTPNRGRGCGNDFDTFTQFVLRHSFNSRDCERIFLLKSHLSEKKLPPNMPSSLQGIKIEAEVLSHKDWQKMMALAALVDPSSIMVRKLHLPSEFPEDLNTRKKAMENIISDWSLFQKLISKG